MTFELVLLGLFVCVLLLARFAADTNGKRLIVFVYAFLMVLLGTAVSFASAVDHEAYLAIARFSIILNLVGMGFLIHLARKGRAWALAVSLPLLIAGMDILAAISRHHITDIVNIHLHLLRIL